MSFFLLVVFLGIAIGDYVFGFNFGLRLMEKTKLCYANATIPRTSVNDGRIGILWIVDRSVRWIVLRSLRSMAYRNSLSYLSRTVYL